MFDTIGAFKKQFTRVEGGYLIYPSQKVGGKLVTEEEYEHLVGAWERVAGRSGRWKIIGATVAVISLWTLLSEVVAPPKWLETTLIAGIVVTLSTWILWVSNTPRRLVKNRLPVTPPRKAAEARRDARSALSWRFVIFALFFSGATFLGSASATERSTGKWAVLIGSGAMLGLYIWITLRKLTDRTR